MKMNKISALCKFAKTINIYEYNGTQFVGNGFAAYPLYGMAELDEDSLFIIFDVPEKKQDSYDCNVMPVPSGISFDDGADFENIIEQSDFRIDYKGTMLMPLETSQGIVFMDAALLAPLADENNVELYERITKGKRPYIVAKAGFMLLAVFMPLGCITKQFCEKLADLSSKCTGTFEMNAAKNIYSMQPQEEQLMFNNGEG